MHSRYLIIPLLLFIGWSCAQQGSPSGGPRDEEPPRVAESTPPNYSTRFAANRIQITFDEYIVLENVNQELVVSPPMEEKPEVKLRGRTLIIEFEEELKDSTTYTFNFGSAIKDLHEGNKLLNFEYVFSTGDVLDSLSVRGSLLYAEDLTSPQDPVSIMLYSDLRDSVPLLDIPLYVGKSDDSGVFSVNNLKEGTYKIFALKDGNYNLLFDMPTEEIAFLDSAISLDPGLIRRLIEADSSMTADSSTLAQPPVTDNLHADSLHADSLHVPPIPDYNAIYVDLLLFTEAVETQYLVEETREDRRRIQLVFAQTLSDTFSWYFLRLPEEEPPPVLELFSPTRDTLDLWLLDSMDYRRDSLALVLSYTVKDTLERHVTQVDTLVMKYRERASRSRKKEEPVEEKLEIRTIRNKGELDLNRDLRLALNFPLAGIRDSLVRFYHIPDTVPRAAEFRLREDSLTPLHLWLEADWQSFAAYRLQVLPGALSSIYGHSHDTLDVNFMTRDEEYYGQILLNLEKVGGPVLVQLFRGKDRVREFSVHEDGTSTISFIPPGEYELKFIHDWNDNGKWDTGNYLRGLQPEDVEFFAKKINVRANWDHEVNMVLEK